MNLCLTCTHWRRLRHHESFGLCKKFQTFKITLLDSNAALAMCPSTHEENWGLPTDGVITGFGFGCIHHTASTLAPTPTVTKMKDVT